MDPVDETPFAPESPSNPSATRALAASGLPVAMAAAGVVGRCNPAGSGYRRMWPAAGRGSWLSVLPGAAHATFAEGGAVVDVAADLLCGRGSDSRAQVVDLVAPQALAWLWQELESGGGAGAAAAAAGAAAAAEEAAVAEEEAAAAAADGPAAAPWTGYPSPLPGFFEWVATQQAAGRLKFQIKRGGPVFEPFAGAPAPAAGPVAFPASRTA